MVDDLRIDTDGKASDEMKQRNYYGDLDHAADNETSYFQDRIAADEIPYFVIPYKTKKQKEKFNKYGWSVGILINFDTTAPKDKWNAVASQKPEIMRNKIYAQGRKCFTGDGKCLNKNKKLNKEKKVK